MSYILDALKKSEQERQKNAGPTLQTIHRPVFADNRKGSLFWVMLLLSIVLSSAIVLTSWRYLWQEDSAKSDVLPTAQTSHPVETSHPVDRTAPLTHRSRESSAEQLLPPEPAGARQIESDYDVISPRLSTTTQKRRPVVEFWELPDPVQKAIPALTFSFHVYSDNPTRRTIIINNRRVREGDKVADGLMLEEITVDGVVLGWQRFRFRINVVEQW